MERQVIIPAQMERLVATAGYVPAVLVDKFVFCAGQVGRDAELTVITPAEAQFTAAWENLRLVLAEAGCDFEDIVDMTTYHVNLSEHFAVFRDVKNRFLPPGAYAWTVIGVAELAKPGLLVEIKCLAVKSARENSSAHT